MNLSSRYYIAIDLKSFYASVECIERQLDPLTTNLVVADRSRTDKTICLAVSPSLKKQGISGRPRLFEVVQRVNEINAYRQMKAPNHIFLGKTYDDTVLRVSSDYALDYIVAPPRMALYMDYSTRIYKVYLKYIAPEDIHVYSIDEVFMEVTDYLNNYKMAAKQLAAVIVKDIFNTTGITAAVGIGTNLYLCKIAMDIMAKRVPADKEGMHIAELDEALYRKLLWTHRPLTDFWRVGRGYSQKLEAKGIYTMGDIAKCSVGEPRDYYNEDLLYKLFGVNAELLIDHAWGWEPCTVADIKSYKPSEKSVGSGQVLQSPYAFEKARLIIREMADFLALELVDKGFMTDQLVITVGYDIENLKNPVIREQYKGEVKVDHYGRNVPKHAHGTINFKGYTSSSYIIVESALKLFDRIADKSLLVRRVNVSANHVLRELDVVRKGKFEQLDLFTDYEELQKKRSEEQEKLEKEKRVQEAVINIKKKYGKNAVLKGMSFESGATSRERNEQIGGHRA